MGERPGPRLGRRRFDSCPPRTQVSPAGRSGGHRFPGGAPPDSETPEQLPAPAPADHADPLRRGSGPEFLNRSPGELRHSPEVLSAARTGVARQALSLDVTPRVRCVPRPAVPVGSQGAACTAQPLPPERHPVRLRPAWAPADNSGWSGDQSKRTALVRARDRHPHPQRTATSAALHAGKVTPDAGSSVTVRRRDAGTRAGAACACTPTPPGKRVESPAARRQSPSTTLVALGRAGRSGASRVPVPPWGRPTAAPAVIPGEVQRGGPAM